MARKLNKPAKQPTGAPADWIEGALAIDDVDSHEYWDFVGLLQRRGDRQTLDLMLQLSRGDWAARRLALNVLGKFGEPERTFESEITARLLEMWDENAGDAASDLVAALGHYAGDARVRQKLLPLVEHPDFEVRWHLTQAFGSDGSSQSTPALIALSRDGDEAIRDWATFALGNGYEPYTPAVRAALVARLDDDDATTRKEAIYALAERGDARVLDAVLRAFAPNEKGETLFDLVSEAPDYRLLPALCKMRESGDQSDADIAKLRAAIAVCERDLA